ncbi:MAG: hypothetical protein IJS60_10370 [Abditibacteriota bacterium]|nr:hypothetical protein [Abditibacteriota bacterium]
MKKAFIFILIFILFNANGKCQSNFTSNINDFKSYYSGCYDLSNEFVNYKIGPFDKQNNWSLSIEPNDLYTNKELLNEELIFDRTLLDINKNTKINLYRKYAKSFSGLQNSGYVVVLEKNKDKEILFYRIKNTEESLVAKYWHDYPIEFYDAITNKDLNEIYIIYMNYEGSFFYLYINRNDKITIREMIPPPNSVNANGRHFKSFRFWNENVYRCETKDGSIEYYKLYIDYDDYSKNIKKGSDTGLNRLVYWNNKGEMKFSELDKSWDYSDNEPEFNLDGWYYNEMDNKVDLSFFR